MVLFLPPPSALSLHLRVRHGENSNGSHGFCSVSGMDARRETRERRIEAADQVPGRQPGHALLELLFALLRPVPLDRKEKFGIGIPECQKNMGAPNRKEREREG